MASWTRGGLIVTGSLTVNATWNVTVGEKDAMATLAKPTALTVDPACATLVTKGVVQADREGDEGNAHAVTVTWTTCGTKTVTSR